MCLWIVVCVWANITGLFFIVFYSWLWIIQALTITKPLAECLLIIFSTLYVVIPHLSLVMLQVCCLRWRATVNFWPGCSGCGFLELCLSFVLYFLMRMYCTITDGCTMKAYPGNFRSNFVTTGVDSRLTFNRWLNLTLELHCFGQVIFLLTWCYSIDIHTGIALGKIS